MNAAGEKKGEEDVQIACDEGPPLSMAAAISGQVGEDREFGAEMLVPEYAEKIEGARRLA